MSKVGMIILNYNDYETTSYYLKEINKFKSLDRIIVVDNNSTDGSFEKLKSFKNDKIDIVKTDNNKGYASGNNYGIKYLNDNYDIDYVIISNPDISVTDSVIERLAKDLDNNDDIALVAPIISQLGENIRGWRLPTIKDEILSNINFYHRKVEQNLRYAEEKYTGNLTKVDVVSGCFFMIRNSILKLIGNFDEGTFLYYEENIIGQKLKNIDKKTFIDNEVTVTHNLSVSVNKSFDSIKKYKILKQSQKYYVKYYLKPNFFGIILLAVTYRISLAVAYVVCFIRSLRSKNK